MSIDLDWYAVVTEAQREEVAQRALRQIGVATYIPEHRALVRRGHCRVPVLRKTFPGYVFVGLQREREPWMRIGECSAVVGLVGFGDPPVPFRLDARDIGDMRFRQWRGFADAEDASPVRLGRGARLPADYPDAALAGRIGRIVHVISDERIILQLGGERRGIGGAALVSRRLDEIELV